MQGPFYEQTGSPLQRVFGDGGVLRVHFADMKKNSEIVEGVYRRVAREGLWIGLRHYMFFGRFYFSLYYLMDQKNQLSLGIFA